MTQGRELVVGSTVIAAILVSAVGTLWLRGTNWGREATYVEVLVLDVGQLTTGNPVKLRGVSIGNVASITVDPGGDVVRLGLEVEGAFDLGNAVSAGVIIAPQSLFGGWQAEIVRRARFPQFDYFDVPAADQGRDTLVIGGYAIPDISRLTAAADEISQNLSVLTDRFDRTFNEQTVDQLRSVIANLEVVSSEIRNLITQQASTFADVSADVARAADEISQASAQANTTFREVDAMLDRGDVDSILVSVRSTAANINRVAAQVNRSIGGLDQAVARADSAFGSVQRFTSRMESGQGALGRLLLDSTLAVRAESAMAQLDSLLADIKANPRRYVRLSIF
jgi:phospholipid/cholesterol/gamma-HCH transport system substrate-binding protein